MDSLTVASRSGLQAVANLIAVSKPPTCHKPTSPSGSLAVRERRMVHVDDHSDEEKHSKGAGALASTAVRRKSVRDEFRLVNRPSLTGCSPPESPHGSVSLTVANSGLVLDASVYPKFAIAVAPDRTSPKKHSLHSVAGRSYTANL